MFCSIQMQTNSHLNHSQHIDFFVKRLFMNHINYSEKIISVSYFCFILSILSSQFIDSIYYFDTLSVGWTHLNVILFCVLLYTETESTEYIYFIFTRAVYVSDICVHNVIFLLFPLRLKYMLYSAPIATYES